MRILVIGAGGRVGTYVCRELAGSHELRLLDVNPIREPAGQVVQGSITDWTTVCDAVAGMDAVVHLAVHHPGQRAHQPYHQYMQDDVDVSVKATDLLLYAAQEASVQRFVYISSLNVYSAAMPEPGQYLHDSDPPLSREHYGTMKLLAEEVCRHYALCNGVSAIVLRLNSVTLTESWLQADQDRARPEYSCSRVHVLDVARAVRLAVEKPGLKWGRCTVSGANRQRRYDTTAAFQLIGFRARYGFEAGKLYCDGQIIDPKTL